MCILVSGAHMHRVTKFDRWLLAWVKRYPSAAEVPDKVTYVLYLCFINI